jgi:HEAT repeat protein
MLTRFFGSELTARSASARARARVRRACVALAALAALKLDSGAAIQPPAQLFAAAAFQQAAAAPAAQEPAAAPSAELAELLARFNAQGERAEPQLAREIAGHRQRPAFDGLSSAYERVHSPFVRREILRVLSLFDGAADSQQAALTFLSNVATNAEQHELRSTAIETIAQFRALGGPFLRKIVEAPADADVRQRALAAHIARGDSGAAEWYRELAGFGGDPLRAGKATRAVPIGKKGAAAQGTDPAAPTPPMRVLAFEAAVGALAPDELVRACAHASPTVRSLALLHLAERGDPRSLELAEQQYERAEGMAEQLGAARVILRSGQRLALMHLLDDTFERQMGLETRLGLARLLSTAGSKEVHDELRKLLLTGNPTEKLTALAAWPPEPLDAKLHKSVFGLLEARDPRIVEAAIPVVAQRLGLAAVPALERLLVEPPEPELVMPAMAELASLRRADPAWVARLTELTRSERPDLRRAAVGALGRLERQDSIPVLREALAHADWSTRFAAARALSRFKDKQVVGWLVERFAHEQGRMRSHLADLLLALTAQLHGESTAAWQGWWRDHEADFAFPSEEQVQLARNEIAARELREVTGTNFFGVPIDSLRVCFVLDVSGSMSERAQGRYSGPKGPTRIAIAKQELTRALRALPSQTLFNVVSFSSGVNAWQGDVLASERSTVDAACAWVEKAPIGGGTNLYGGLERAFADPEVDQIVVLSDGEPSDGDVIDPDEIRARVKLWNDNRGIVISAVAVGGSLKILEWLTQDSGGHYVYVP